MDKSDTKIGARLRNLRQRANLSMRQLAAKAGIAVSYLSGIERDLATPTLATLRRILQALDSNFVDFFSENAIAEDGYFFKRSAMHSVTDSDREYTLIFPKREDIRIEVQDENYFTSENKPEFEIMDQNFGGYVISGNITVEIGNAKPVRLSGGDAFHVPGGTKMRGYCENGEKARLLTFLYPAGTPPKKEENE